MTHDEKTQVIEAHLARFSRPFVEKALRDLEAEFPKDTRVSIELQVVETTALGDAKPEHLRGRVTVTSERHEGTHQEPVRTAVSWEMEHQALVVTSVEKVER